MKQLINQSTHRNVVGLLVVVVVGRAVVVVVVVGIGAGSTNTLLASGCVSDSDHHEFVAAGPRVVSTRFG